MLSIDAERQLMPVCQDLRRSNFTAADVRRANFQNAKLNASYFMKAVAYQTDFTVRFVSHPTFGPAPNEFVHQLMACSVVLLPPCHERQRL